ncbi:MAG: hypothetical protein WCX22_07225 [Methanoregula sp.]
MDRVRSNEEWEIPLFLLPHAIARQIRKTGDKIYRISVKRTHWHHYHVSVRTRTLPKELAPGRGTLVLPEARPVPGDREMPGGAGSV